MLTCYITDRLCLVTDNGPNNGGALLHAIARAARCGVDFIQLREKDLSPRALESLAVAALAAIAGTKTQLLINSRIDVAIAAGVNGVHLTAAAGELTAGDARSIFHKTGITRPCIGVSCHTSEEVASVEAHGADFALFAPVFEKDGTQQSAGLDRLAQACKRPGAAAARMPVLALGGVTAENAAQCLAAGADGIAGIRLFQQASDSDLEALMHRLRQLSLSSARAASATRHPYWPE